MGFWDTTIADRLAWVLPGLAVACGILAGLLTLAHKDDCAAWFAIVGSVASGGGIYATSIASKKRDDQMRFWVDQTYRAQTRPSDGFSS